MKHRGLQQIKAVIIISALLITTQLPLLSFASEDGMDSYGYNPNLDSTITMMYEAPKANDSVTVIDNEETALSETSVDADGIEDHTLIQNYNSKYELYEQSFGSVFFFYTNVANGAITEEAVWIELPKNIKTVIEKDGEPYSEPEDHYYTEKGSYVIQLLAEDNGITKRSVFRFRIMEETMEPSSTPSATPTVTVVPEGTEGNTPTDIPLITPTEIPVVDPETVDIDPSLLTEEELEKLLSGELSYEEIIDRLKGEITSTPIPESSETEAYTGLNEEYDSSRNQFKETLRSGTYFYSSIPNGMITNDAVSFSFPETEGLTVTVTRDDADYPYTQGDKIELRGVYKMTFQQTKVDYLLNYTTPPQFTFRIITTAVKNIEIVNPPAGFLIDLVIKDGEEQTLESKNYYILQKDGVYRLTFLSNDEYAIRQSVSITKDTVPPAVTVTTDGASAQFTYPQNDVARIRIFKDNAEYTNFSWYELDDPGEYLLYIYDAADNYTTVSLSLKYRINTAGIFAIIIFIILIAGAFGYFRYTKKNVSVR